jgi:hypothetical protein
MATSSSWPSAASSAIVISERSRFESCGRDQTEPQAPSVMKVWNGSSKSVIAAVARSTWESPSTARRVFMPVANRSLLARSSVILRPVSDALR